MTGNTTGVSRRSVLVAGGAAAAATVLRPLIGADNAAYAQSVEPPAVPRMALWYDKPATNWESQALPIGNGRLGAMLFGGVDIERIQLNEQSLWGGVNNYDNAAAGVGDGVFDTSMTGFGSYRNFGELLLTFDGSSGATRVTAPGGPYQDSNSSQTVTQTYDGNTASKWCIIAPPAQVLWQASLAAPRAVTSYSLTSANDVPQRDPQNWRFEGSMNGTSWTTLDSRQQPPFESRGQTKTFSFANSQAYNHYRFVFLPVSGVSHFQVAEIALAGVVLAPGLGVTQVSAPGGPYQDSNTSETVAQTFDGNPASKWCIVSPPSQVLWQAGLASPAVVTSYSLTSANDVPQRDPQNWRFEGSVNGTSWTILDTRQQAPFENRGQTKSFSFANSQAYVYYRFVFLPLAGVSHFQVAEIALAGVSLTGGTAVANYKRFLDPVTARHVTSFGVTGGRVVREAFASRDADILVLRYRTEKATGLSGTIAITSGQNADSAEPSTAAVASAAGDRLSFANAMRNTLRYAAEVRVRGVGGTLAGESGQVRFTGCTELELRVDLRTDYRLNAAANWRNGVAPAQTATNTLNAAAQRGYDQLFDTHTAAFGAIMTRVSINTGRSDDAVVAMPMNTRLARFKDGSSADPELEQLHFHYGRYLLASSSRPGGLPANLQGLWNNVNQPAWGSDYHTNINIQMNYWGAETADLGESHLALVDFIEQVAVPSRVASRRKFGTNIRGWTARTSQSPFGGNSWEWNTPASAWYMQHVYEHWAFSQDRAYLQRVYPLVREICQFWQDRLIERTVDGQPRLLAPQGWSPEHGPVEDGVMHDQQIIWDLFTNYLEMATALDVDSDFRATVDNLRSRLAPNKIGNWGQLQEWQTDRDQIGDLHRHTSHLFAVYPGRQISKSLTPAFATAALKSLNARCGAPNGETIGVDTVSGDSRRSWTWPWRLAMFARLGEPERAYTMLRGLFRHSTLDNLFATHPPFQMDGNFGMSGAMVELLLQSHDGKITLLPACPQAWRAQGSFQGLRARGGYKVSASWTNGSVTTFKIIADRAPNLNPVTVVVNGQARSVTPTRS